MFNVMIIIADNLGRIRRNADGRIQCDLAGGDTLILDIATAKRIGGFAAAAEAVEAAAVRAPSGGGSGGQGIAK